jgi:hypothetical protein
MCPECAQGRAAGSGPSCLGLDVLRTKIRPLVVTWDVTAVNTRLPPQPYRSRGTPWHPAERFCHFPSLASPEPGAGGVGASEGCGARRKRRDQTKSFRRQAHDGRVTQDDPASQGEWWVYWRSATESGTGRTRFP